MYRGGGCKPNWPPSWLTVHSLSRFDTYTIQDGRPQRKALDLDDLTEKLGTAKNLGTSLGLSVIITVTISR